MTDEQHETRVVFRRWSKKYGGGVIALFPDEKENRPGMVMSYEHIGQHGAAHYQNVIDHSFPCTPHDPHAQTLKSELERYPFNYKLKVVQRA